MGFSPKCPTLQFSFDLCIGEIPQRVRYDKASLTLIELAGHMYKFVVICWTLLVTIRATPSYNMLQPLQCLCCALWCRFVSFTFVQRGSFALDSGFLQISS